MKEDFAPEDLVLKNTSWIFATYISNHIDGRVMNDYNFNVSEENAHLLNEELYETLMQKKVENITGGGTYDSGLKKSAPQNGSIKEMMKLAAKQKEIEDLQKEYELEKQQMINKAKPQFQRAKPAKAALGIPQKRKPKPVLKPKKKKKNEQKNLFFFKKVPKKPN